MALRDRQPQQPRGLHIVLRHALAVGVEEAEATLRQSVALRCREPQEPRSLDVVLRDALGMALRCRQLIQPASGLHRPLPCS
jgi:hypothetical protein